MIVSLLYAPHILFQWGGHLTLEMEKYLEIVLYNVVGGITGLLSQRERERSVQLQKTADGLEQSYRKLQEQSEQLITVEKNLRNAERLSTLGEMAAVLAHEIRNPLGSIRGTAEILRDDFPPDSPKYEFIDIQIRETERLNRVVEDFLRMSKPQVMEKISCDIINELQTVISLVADDAAQRHITVKFNAPDTLPLFIGDGEKLRQAFLNIVINALQATPSGGRVTITVDASTSSLEVSFIDSGSGIAPEDALHIFEPFYTTKIEGTGLGLPITKKIIEGHGGTIQLDCLDGNGTAVNIILPLNHV